MTLNNIYIENIMNDFETSEFCVSNYLAELSFFAYCNPTDPSYEPDLPERVRQLLDRGGDVNEKEEGEASMLMKLIAMDENKLVHRLLEAGCDVKAEDYLGDTALMYAVLCDDNAEIIHALIRHGADVNHANRLGITPLMLAAMCSRSNAFTLIIDGANIHARCKEGYTALAFSVDSIDSTASLLLQYGAKPEGKDIHGTPLSKALADDLDAIPYLKKYWETHRSDLQKLALLHHAATAGDAESVLALLSINGLLNEQDAQGNTPLHCAAKSHNALTITRILIEHGAFAGITNARGETPLHIAAGQQQLPTMLYLISRGLDLNDRDNFGRTPMTKLLGCPVKPEDIQRFISLGGKWETCELDGRSPLSIAAQTTPSTPLFEYLLHEMAEDINRPDNEGITPLMWATRNSNAYIVQLLIKAGANVHAQDCRGRNALAHAVRYAGAARIVQRILDAGARVDERLGDGSLPIHWAVPNRNIDIMQKLLNAKADINAQDAEGNTPLIIAAYDDIPLHQPDGHRANPTLCNHAGYTAADITRMIDSGAIRAKSLPYFQ